jgi:hypothetical protein
MSEVKKLQALSTQEIDSYLKDDEGLLKLVSYCVNVFSCIDKINFLIKDRQIMDGHSTDENLCKVAGYRGFLSPILSAMMTHLDSIKTEKYLDYEKNIMSLNQAETTKRAVAFSSTTAEHHAENGLKDLIIFKNRLYSYNAQCETLITILQSKLKYYISTNQSTRISNQG